MARSRARYTARVAWCSLRRLVKKWSRSNKSNPSRSQEYPTTHHHHAPPAPPRTSPHHHHPPPPTVKSSHAEVKNTVVDADLEEGDDLPGAGCALDHQHHGVAEVGLAVPAVPDLEIGHNIGPRTPISIQQAWRPCSVSRVLYTIRRACMHACVCGVVWCVVCMHGWCVACGAAYRARNT